MLYLRIRKAPVTIWSLLLSAYIISQCRYRSMHLSLWRFLSLPTQLSVSEVQSTPPSSGTSYTIFKFDCSYYLCASYNEKPRGCAPNNNFYSWRFLCITIEIELLGKSGYIRMVQDLQDIWESTRWIKSIQVSTVFIIESKTGY